MLELPLGHVVKISSTRGGTPWIKMHRTYNNVQMIYSLDAPDTTLLKRGLVTAELGAMVFFNINKE